MQERQDVENQQATNAKDHKHHDPHIDKHKFSFSVEEPSLVGTVGRRDLGFHLRSAIFLGEKTDVIEFRQS